MPGHLDLPQASHTIKTLRNRALGRQNTLLVTHTFMNYLYILLDCVDMLLIRRSVNISSQPSYGIVSHGVV